MQDIACSMIKVKGERLVPKWQKAPYKHREKSVENRKSVVHWNSSAAALKSMLTPLTAIIFGFVTCKSPWYLAINHFNVSLVAYVTFDMHFLSFWQGGTITRSSFIRLLWCSFVILEFDRSSPLIFITEKSEQEILKKTNFFSIQV